MCSPRWLKAHLDFQPHDSAGDHVVHFWCAVGVEAPFLHYFEDLQPYFDGQTLYVNDSFQTRKDEALASLELMYLHCFQFRTHTDSRWATQGGVCRVLVACMALGLTSIIDYLQEHQLVSEFYSGGLKYLNQELSWYCVCVSFVAYPTDAVLLTLMADDRVVLRQDELRQAFFSEHAWLGSLAGTQWERLVGVVGSPLQGHDLRHAVLHGVQVSWAYLRARVFDVLDELPWVLARGNRAENLKKLLAGSEVQEPISRKIRCLHRLGPLLLSHILLPPLREPPTAHPRHNPIKNHCGCCCSHCSGWHFGSALLLFFPKRVAMAIRFAG